MTNERKLPKVADAERLFNDQAHLLGFKIDSVRADLVEGRVEWFTGEESSEESADHPDAFVFVAEAEEHQELVVTLRRQLKRGSAHVEIVLSAHYELPPEVDYSNAKYSALRSRVVKSRALPDAGPVFSSIGTAAIGLLNQVPGRIPALKAPVVVDQTEVEFVFDDDDEEADDGPENT